ncbi:MAG: hypothetical protein ACK5YC_09705, partial [Planctomyces sp.]
TSSSISVNALRFIELSFMKNPLKKNRPRKDVYNCPEKQRLSQPKEQPRREFMSVRTAFTILRKASQFCVSQNSLQN